MQNKNQTNRDHCGVCKPLAHIIYIYGITNMQIILKLYLVVYLIFLLVALISTSELIDLKSLISPILVNHYLLTCYCQKPRGHPWFHLVSDIFHLPQWDLLSILLFALCNRLLACKDYSFSVLWLPVSVGQKGAPWGNQK